MMNFPNVFFHEELETDNHIYKYDMTRNLEEQNKEVIKMLDKKVLLQIENKQLKIIK